VCDLAVSTPDAGFLNGRHISFISDEERREILQHVRTSLLPQLDSCVESWRDNYRGGEEPSFYFSSLEEALKDYGKAFADDAEVEVQIADALGKIEEAVEELSAPDPDHDYSAYGRQQSGALMTDGSAIFDDVDQ
jgi:hypothetical protein